jgi:hypothetical protein
VPRLEPPEHPRHDRIPASLIVIDEVLVTERDAEYPLADQGRKIGHDPIASKAVIEAPSEPLDQPDPRPPTARRRHST